MYVHIYNPLGFLAEFIYLLMNNKIITVIGNTNQLILNIYKLLFT